jgi:hypothetical protein
VRRAVTEHGRAPDIGAARLYAAAGPAACSSEPGEPHAALSAKSGAPMRKSDRNTGNVASPAVTPPWLTLDDVHLLTVNGGVNEGRFTVVAGPTSISRGNIDLQLPPSPSET